LCPCRARSSMKIMTFEIAQGKGSKLSPYSAIFYPQILAAQDFTEAQMIDRSTTLLK
jgi:hypothetical protein